MRTAPALDRQLARIRTWSRIQLTCRGGAGRWCGRRHRRCSASTALSGAEAASPSHSSLGSDRLCDLPCSGDFSPGRGGLLQLLGVSLPPCCCFHPAEAKVPHRSDFGASCCLCPTVAGSALGFTHFRGHIRVHCCYGPVARDLPEEDLVDRLQSLGFPPPCYPNYGAPDSCPGRFISC